MTPDIARAELHRLKAAAAAWQAHLARLAAGVEDDKAKAPQPRWVFVNSSGWINVAGPRQVRRQAALALAQEAAE